MFETVHQAKSASNPYSVDIMVKTDGPIVKLFCRYCERVATGTLDDVRLAYFYHQEKAHGVLQPRLMSFYMEENREEAEDRVQRMWQAGLTPKAMFVIPTRPKREDRD